MRKNLTDSQSDVEYLRAYHMEVAQCEADYECMIEGEWHTTKQRGVLCFHLTAVGPVIDVGLMVPFAQVKGTYPNGSSRTLSGWLFNQALKLTSMVAELRDEEVKRANRTKS